jgi:hypothetical protein
MDASIEGDGWIYRKNTKGGFKHYRIDSKLNKKNYELDLVLVFRSPSSMDMSGGYLAALQIPPGTALPYPLEQQFPILFVHIKRIHL